MKSKTVIHSLLVFSLLFAVLGFAVRPAAAAADAAITCTQFHTVKRGENLFRIGQFYGVNWRTLAQVNNLANPRLIFTGQRLCVAWTDGVQPAPQPSPGRIPTFSIVSVVRNQSVTIRTANFPANDNFRVTMGAFGTRGVGGILVDTINSGQGGSFNATFNVPAELHGSRRIAIRLQSPTSGFFAFNWFFNNTTGTGTGTGDPSPTPGYSGFPTFSILSVVRDDSVTIRTHNMPPNTTFDVLMNVMGTRGVNGIKVETINSGQGGVFTDTYTIPASLRGLNRIAIRLQSPTTGYFAYNWFWNR